MLLLAIIVILATVAVFHFSSSLSSVSLETSTSTSTPTPILKQEQNTPSPPPVKTGKEETRYYFSNWKDGIVQIALQNNAEFYPKGGTIKITAPSGRTWIDTPGVAIQRPPENPGIFSFSRPKDSKAWGVEVWE
jgi:hypothetical protein